MKVGRVFFHKKTSPNYSLKDKGMSKTKLLVDILTDLAIESGKGEIDAFTLCELCCNMGYQIQTAEAPDLPKRISAVTLSIASYAVKNSETQNQHLILYRPGSIVSVQISILHELCHILLKHRKITYEDIKEGKSFYTHAEEVQAEQLATKLLLRLLQQFPQNALWEQILEQKVILKSIAPYIKRFTELMPQKSENRLYNNAPIARFQKICSY